MRLSIRTWLVALLSKKGDVLNMAILNYSTTVEAYKTVSEIENILVKHKAKSILKNYEGESISSMSFMVDTNNGSVPVKLPIKTTECLKLLQEAKKNGTKNIKATPEQAERVAWRVMKDWIEAQMALLDINMVSLEEIFLPYIVDSNGITVYEKLSKANFLLDKE